MLWEEAERFRKLSGEDPEKTSIARIGGFLDGYEKGKAYAKSQCESTQVSGQGDLIDRQSVLALYKKHQPYMAVSVIEFGKELENLPSAEPERKTGKWIHHTYMPHTKYCSNCDEDSPYNKMWEYCPNCGAKMEKNRYETN